MPGRPAAPATGADRRRAPSPRRLTSRTSPSNSGRRTAKRKAARITTSTRSSSGEARSSDRSSASDSSAAPRATAASSSACLEGNQYRIVCLASPSSWPRSSSEVASKPRMPNERDATSRIRWSVRVGAVAMAIRAILDNLVYHLVDTLHLPSGNDARRPRGGPLIRQRLSGKRIAITGSTGFLGTALVERLLRTRARLRVGPPRAHRPPWRAATASHARCSATTRSNACGANWAGAKAFDEMTARRVVAISGDVSIDGLGLDEDGRQAVASCDIFIHSAATVSFDSPLDSAVEVNLLGPVRIVSLMNELGVHRASRRGLHLLRRGQPPRRRTRRAHRRESRSSSTSTGAKKSTRRDAPVSTPRRRAAPPTA